MWFLLPLAAAAAPCARTLGPDQVEERLDTAVESLSAGDVEQLEQDLAFAILALQCLTDSVPPNVAARTHRLYGILRHARGDKPRAQSHFRAAVAVEPDSVLPVYPPGHPIQQLYREAHEPKSIKVDSPSNGPLFIDGQASRSLDLKAAHLLQYRESDQPTLTLLELRAQQTPPWMASIKAKRTRRTALLTAGGASLAAAVGLGIANVLSAQSFTTTTGSVDSLKGAQRRTNVLAGAAIGAGAVGIGLTVTGVVAK